MLTHTNYVRWELRFGDLHANENFIKTNFRSPWVYRSVGASRSLLHTSLLPLDYYYVYSFGFIHAFHDLAGGGVYAFRLDLVLLFCYNRDNAGTAMLFAVPRVGRFFSFSRLPRSKG